MDEPLLNRASNDADAEEIRFVTEEVAKDEEADRLAKQQYGLLSVLKFCTWLDVAIYLLGLICAAGFGAVLPLQSVVLGKIFTGSAGVDDNALKDNIDDHIPDLLKLGCIAFSTGYLQHICLTTTGERVMKRIRHATMESLLKQEVAFFDRQTTGRLSTLLNDQSMVLARSLTQSIGSTVNYLSQMISGFIIAFSMSYKVALAMLLVVPMNTFVVITLVVVIMRHVRRANENDELAGGFAEEVLAGIQTVASMCGEVKAIMTFNTYLTKRERISRLIQIIRAIGVGSIFACIFLSYGLGYWYGSKVVASMDASFGDVLSSVFSCVIGSIAIGIAMPNVQAVMEGHAAVGELFVCIFRQPKLKQAEEGKIIKAGTDGTVLGGDVEFRNVRFHYPGREQIILGNVSFHAKRGETTALVGHSGSGKSTCIALLERFYDPEAGEILFDGVNIQKYDLEFLRKHVALVSQEPILFNTTIKENILLGKQESSDTDEADVLAAAMSANAHDFILGFPDGYDTDCGASGTKLSGGQKQRISIARALIRNPSLLLLDEATSALDNESEATVQKAIDNLLSERSLTTIIIAHRLSTIRNADQIVVFQPDVDGNGSSVVENGTHDELMKIENGAYRGLVELGDAKPKDGEPITQRDNRNTRSASHISESGDERWGSPLSSRSNSMLLAEFATPLSVERRDSLTNFASPNSSFASPSRRPSKIDRYDEKNLYPVSRTRLFQLNRPEWKYFFMGAIGASIKGAAQPCMSLIMSHLLINFVVVPIPLLDTANCKDDCEGLKGCYDFGQFWGNGTARWFCYDDFFEGHSPHDVRATGVEALLYYLGLGGAVGIGLAISLYCFAYAGLKLNSRLRDGVFSSLCRQDSAFFDQESNDVGTLLARLSTDPRLVQNTMGDQTGMIVENFVAVLVALGIAFDASYRMTRVVFLPCALLIYSSYSDQRRLSQFAREQVLDTDSQKIVNQSLNSVRTIYSCTAQDKITKMYDIALEGPKRAAVRAAHVMGFQTGFSQACYQIIYSFAFWYGGHLISQGLIDSQSLSKVFFVLTITATFIGQSIAQGQDTAKADVAASNIFQLIDRKSPIDYTSTQGVKDVKLKGLIQFSNVHFRYPTRPGIEVLRGFTCTIEPGQSVAFVGPSGSGKSSIIRLLERFYDVAPGDGTIFIDGVNIQSYNVKFLRSQIGLVGQEPILFEGSIKDNVLFGCNDGILEPTMEQVIEACKAANAHEFIQSFPQGYDTQVGAKGSQLSGGQKSRIAIARAIIKNPTILLLDEATAALDNESQRIVQDSLDTIMSAQKRMTKIIVAHRLSTIINSDKIIVLHQGVVSEMGSHDELMNIPDGRYQNLFKAQDSNEN